MVVWLFAVSAGVWVWCLVPKWFTAGWFGVVVLRVWGFRVTVVGWFYNLICVAVVGLSCGFAWPGGASDCGLVQILVWLPWGVFLGLV